MKFNQVYQTNKPFENPERKPSSLLPKPPINIFVISPYLNGVLDVRWDNPNILPENTAFSIVGVNLYRSFDSESGPYHKVNSEPLSSGIYRDKTTNNLISDESVQNLERGLNPQKEWRFKTKFFPIVKNSIEVGKTLLEGNLADSKDIVVKVDNGDGNGLMEVPIHKISSLTGEITLISQQILDPATEKMIPPRLPLNTLGALTISYYINSNKIKSNLHNRIFYKLTTVGINSQGELVESELEFCKPVNLYQQEKTDWMWKEAVRRNRWILEQGGERVKVFVRKWNGHLCEEFSEVHQNSPSDCPICYGTNIVGGYEGPFDIIIAPPDAEKNVELTEIGIRVNYTWETWTGPSPMLNKRDLIIRPSGERFSVGSINYVGQRGAIFQQMFTLQQLDMGDIVYSVGLEGTNTNLNQAVASPIDPWNSRSERVGEASPIITSDKPTNRNYPLEKGRTVTFEDIVY
jgi:hypothetical protein